MWKQDQSLNVAQTFLIPTAHIIDGHPAFCHSTVRESPRWLLTKGRTEEAWETLQVMAETNGMELPEKDSIDIIREVIKLRYFYVSLNQIE